MKIIFTPSDEQSRATPPEPIKKHLPNWYKEMSTMIEGAEFTASYLSRPEYETPYTIKKCIPFSEILTSGYVLRCHTEILVDPINIPNDGLSFSWRWAGGKEPIAKHVFGQFPFKINNKNNIYIKYVNPWVIKTPPGYSCLFMQPFDIKQKNIVFFSGIVDTDTYDDFINFPGYINSKTNFKIDCGEPMMAVFPFKRDDWQMEISKGNFDPSKSKATLKRSQFLKYIYRNFFHTKKSYD